LVHYMHLINISLTIGRKLFSLSTILQGAL
jgi:hypothetical protein